MMKKDDQIDQQRQKSASRKPYLKPSFQRERVFETMALSCGKVNTTQAQCKLNTKNS